MKAPPLLPWQVPAETTHIHMFNNLVVVVPHVHPVVAVPDVVLVVIDGDTVVVKVAVLENNHILSSSPANLLCG